MTHKTVLVWDTKEEPPEGTCLTILWRSFELPNNRKVLSIPQIIESQSDILRRRYLSWLYELGETRLPDKRLVDILAIRPDLSYWWLTLLAEKCNWAKSPHINHVIRLFVLEEFLKSNSVEQLFLVTCNQDLVKVVRDLCKKKDIRFQRRKKSSVSDKKYAPKRTNKRLPVFLEGILYASRYIWERRSLLYSKKVVYGNYKNGITFIDYFINFDSKKFKLGNYSSHYWEGLLESIGKNSNLINWLHLFVSHANTPTPKSAATLAQKFNQNHPDKEKHSTLDQWLSFLVMLGTLSDYFRLLRICIYYRFRIVKAFRPSGSQLDLWPLYKKEWYDSFCGPTAVWNCITLNLLEAVFKRIPHQKLGFYLQENQGWEIALIHVWQAAGHGRLIGVPHSTVRFWDLRYFSDRRVLVDDGLNCMPQPECIALNGPAMKQAYIKGEYPEKQIREVEALRYLYLANCSAKTVGQHSSLSILLCGDYLFSTSHKMMMVLCEAAKELPKGTCFVVKPHPSCPINPEDYPSLDVTMTDSPLVEIFPECDVVLTSNISSAAVDAYCAGLPVVSLLDGEGLNMSPLRGIPGVTYVFTPSELSCALLNSIKKYGDRSSDALEKFFWLEKDLPRWRSLLRKHLGSEIV